MAFNVTYTATNGITEGEKVYPAQINQNYADIVAELNAVGTAGALKAGAVGTTAIADNSIDYTKLMRADNVFAIGTSGTTGTTTRITNVTNPSDAQDVATKKYVDDTKMGNYGTVTTITATVGSSAESEIAITGPAATDFFLQGTCYASADRRARFLAYTCTTSGGTYVLRGAMSVYGYGTDVTAGSFLVFVKKGSYYQVTREAQASLGDSITRSYCSIPVGS
jgi:hypothetical protein